jgi:hypothetical protein
VIWKYGKTRFWSELVLVDKEEARTETKYDEPVEARHVPIRAPGELINAPF